MTFNEMFLIDLGGRLQYGIKVNVDGSIKTLTDIYSDMGFGFDNNGVFYGHKSFEMKPYLRPLSSMTEAEVTQIEMLGWRRDEYTKEIWGSADLSQALSLIDWLNAHYFDYHHLIEKGLALEAPADMYEIG